MALHECSVKQFRDLSEGRRPLVILAETERHARQALLGRCAPTPQCSGMSLGWSRSFQAESLSGGGVDTPTISSQAPEIMNARSTTIATAAT